MASQRVDDPKDLHATFKRCLEAGDLDGLVSLYEPDATIIPSPGNVVTGHEAIREALTAFVEGQALITFEPAVVTASGNIALVHARWTGTVGPADGRVDIAGVTSEIVRRQPDGRWLYVVDDPYTAV